MLLASAILGLAGLGVAVAAALRLRRVDRARRDAEARLAAFVDSTSHWLWETDADLRFSYLSRAPAGVALSDLLGRRREEVADTGFAPESWREHLSQLAAREPFQEFIYCFEGRGREPRFFSTSGRPVYDTAGRFLGYRGTGRDMSGEIAARANAVRAERQLMEAIESISVGFALYDAEDRLIVCNDRFRSFYQPIAEHLVPGLDFTEVTRLAAEAGLIPEAVGRVEAWMQERLDWHRRADGTFDLVLADGRRLLISEHRTSDGSIAVVQTDVTPLKAREAALDDQSRLLAATIDGIAEGLVAFDADKRLLVWNDQFVQMFELPADMMTVGRPFEDFVRHNAARGEYGEGEIDDIVAARTAATDRRVAHRFERLRANGTVIEVRRRYLDNGGWVTTFVDVTDRKRGEFALQTAKEQAELANRAKTNFLANMSHELRTPLNAIIGFSEIVKDELLGPIGTRRYLDYINDIHMSGSHLLEVINDILDLSKVESGKFELLEKAVDMSRVIASTLRLMRDKAAKGELSVETVMPTPPPTIIADERALKQILLNLLSNAVKFTRAGGTVQIRVELPESGELLLVVQDTGIGISPLDLPKALAPFGQVDSTLTRKYQGTGLGLPLVKSLAELHGGTLELESTVDVGTRAIVRLPSRRVMPMAPASERRAQP
jgi:signal transduction histidine kinase